MTQINWGLAYQPNSFQNALSQGLQFGQHIRQRREQEAQRNALADYAANPTPEGLTGLAPYAPEFVLQERGRQADAERQARAERIEQIREQGRMMGRLLTLAGDDPQAALSAAQRMQMDVSGIPQLGTPEFEAWRQESLLMARAMEEDPEGLTGNMQEAMAITGKPMDDPETRAVLANIRGRNVTWQPGGGAAQISATGEVTPLVVPGSAPAQGGGMPAGSPLTPPGRFEDAIDYASWREQLVTRGPAIARGMLSDGMAVRVNTPEEADTLPSGTRIILPDGSEGVVP